MSEEASTEETDITGLATGRTSVFVAQGLTGAQLARRRSICISHGSRLSAFKVGISNPPKGPLPRIYPAPLAQLLQHSFLAPSVMDAFEYAHSRAKVLGPKRAPASSAFASLPAAADAAPPQTPAAMITASGAGAAFVAIPPRRLKPKQQRLSPDTRSPLLQSQRGPATGPQPQRHPKHLAQKPPSTADSAGTVDSLRAVRDGPFPAPQPNRGRPAFLGGTDDASVDYSPSNGRSSSPGPPSTIGPDGVSLYRAPTWESTNTASTVRTGAPRPEDDLRRFRLGGGVGYPERHPSPPLSAIGVPVDRRPLKTQPSFAGSEASLVRALGF